MDGDEAWKRDRIGSARSGTNPTVLARLTRSFAVIGDTQFLPGYCVLLVDDPAVDRLTDLPKQQRRQFLEDMDTLGEALETACRATDPAFRRTGVALRPGEFYGPVARLGPQHDELRARIVAELTSAAAGQGSTSPDRIA